MALTGLIANCPQDCILFWNPQEKAKDSFPCLFSFKRMSSFLNLWLPSYIFKTSNAFYFESLCRGLSDHSSVETVSLWSQLEKVLRFYECTSLHSAHPDNPRQPPHLKALILINLQSPFAMCDNVFTGSQTGLWISLGGHHLHTTMGGSIQFTGP